MAPEEALACFLLLAALVSIAAQALGLLVHLLEVSISLAMLACRNRFQWCLRVSEEARSYLGPSKNSKARSDGSVHSPFPADVDSFSRLFLSDPTSMYLDVLLDRRLDAIRLSQPL